MSEVVNCGMVNLSTSTSPRRTHGSGEIVFNLVLIGLVVALMGVGLAYFVDALGGSAPAGPALNSASPVIEKSIAGRRLAIPPEWFRYSDQKSDGFSEKIDLTFAVPLGAGGSLVNIDVTLTPRSRVRTSDRLLDSVYLHQFAVEQLEGPVGLVGKPLKPVDGFENETVWYDPVSQQPFVAKCTPLIEDPQRASCVRTVLVADQIAATYVFDASLLDAWKNFDPEAQRWLSRIGGI